MNTNLVTQAEIFSFWFGDDNNNQLKESSKWWTRDQQLDQLIKERFLASVQAAINNQLSDWQQTAHGCLALVILLDQFSRNIYRDTANAFTQDNQASEISKLAIEKGLDKQLTLVERWMLYMPFMHSEDRLIQERCIELFQSLANEAPELLKEPLTSALDFANKHKVIIDRFGRYPHRNEILSRESTTEEIEFLQQPGSSF